MTSHTLIVPSPGRDPRGSIAEKPWHRRVTVVIPNINSADFLERCVALHRLQSIQPYILVIDTGTQDPEQLERIEALRGEDCEIHYLRSHSYSHPSEPVSIAMDLSMALCKTRWMLCTHADALPVDREILEREVANAELDGVPAAGYQLTERPHWRNPDGSKNTDYEWMLGHTWTLLDVPFMKRHGITWDFESGYEEMGWDREDLPNAVDTEVFFNYRLRGVRKSEPLIIGTERNYKRNVRPHFDHVRSAPSGELYLPENHGVRMNQKRWKSKALREADKRITEWTKHTQNG